MMQSCCCTINTAFWFHVNENQYLNAVFVLNLQTTASEAYLPRHTFRNDKKWFILFFFLSTNRRIALTNRCVFRYGRHIIVAHKFWCMIIYVTNCNIYIANSSESSVIGLRYMKKHKRKRKKKNAKM